MKLSRTAQDGEDQLLLYVQYNRSCGVVLSDGRAIRTVLGVDPGLGGSSCWMAFLLPSLFHAGFGRRQHRGRECVLGWWALVVTIPVVTNVVVAASRPEEGGKGRRATGGER